VSHDALDNLRTWTPPGEGQRRYDYDGSNRLTVVRNAGGAAIIGLGYDVQGNLSIKNGQGYQFDFGNRLRVATSLERYRYDGDGRRSSVIDAGSGKNRHYLYSQGGALAYIWDQGTGERTQYIQLAGSLVAARKVAGSGAVSVRYQHTDALGSPVAETNEQAAVVLRTAYTPYGASIGAAQDGVGYTGHVMDGSTGLTYMQQRYYDSGLGQFLSIDPVSTLQSPIGAFHRYWYADRSPHGYVDPDGREAVDSNMPKPAPLPKTLPTVTVSAPKPVLGPQPSFFKLTTVEALRRDTSIDQAVRAGELTRTVTLPAVTVTAAPSAAALSASAPPVLWETALGTGSALQKSKAARETLYYACVGIGLCNGERPSMQRIQQQERIQQVKDGAMRETKAKMREIPNP